ncbi:16S rRNA (cytosine(967)-C(5))-methyltransferase RsmB [Aestuariibacter sp. AA17]|uniref:16S rRNA (cytosine(967)-C(5))-methyltransferase n=1 Tax=Fluctibacter corallii TaxID=2984329 RepID=A0ABT3AD49_9ALTE|nr:16S rRNA (cytosine(967)-C(5))-methyltransferase RsmB [Aestuariibacter sp. AA17]MCV2886565.1 16S rRNA (cytosine(967)-C(5))-methyltransferase RsmB [Aestuariibacter sp. AA17]
MSNHSGAKLRAATAKALFDILESGKSSRDVLPKYQAQLKDKDKAWLQEMSFGVLRHLPLLQYWLRDMLQKPLKGNQKIIEHLILLGFYQLAFSRVSAHAAVAETVAACNALNAPGLKGLVNAVLRNFQRQDKHLQKPDDPQINSGLPKWLYKRLLTNYPEQIDAIVESMHTRAPVWLRVNRQKIARDAYFDMLPSSINAHKHATLEDAIIIPKSVDVVSLPGFTDGLFAVQDGAAQLAASLLSPQENERILDCCAAPGGKTCHILELQPSLSACIALDIDKARLERVEENLLRLNHNATLVAGDAVEVDTWWDGKPFDRILLDAPCSATGVIRRHPDIKWLRKSKDIEELVAIQQDILSAMWKILKPGGTLLYATCSILPEENSQQIAKFLARTPSASLLPVTKTETTDNPGRQILPGEDQMDGFYYARLLKS